MEDKIDLILEALKQKACVKQKIYRNTLEVFAAMKEEGKSLVQELSERFQDVDTSVKIEYLEKGEFEFHLKFSGDLLIFTMHSNVVSFPPDHILSKSPYILEDPDRGFFGHIMIYNFMADSIKYNRLNDPGYLVARLLLNVDGHFYVEGVRQLSFLYPDVSVNKLDRGFLRLLIESSMLTAIGQDLVAPNFQEIQMIPYGHKVANQMISSGSKIGFQMTAERSEL